MVLKITMGGNAGQGYIKGHLVEEVGATWLEGVGEWRQRGGSLRQEG